MHIEDTSWKCPYGKDKLLLVQEILWEMFILISDIFDKNNITYFLSYGSMLGALRHNGFIPWDDDFDICVMRDDYEKAIELLNKELPLDKYVVHNKSNDSIYWLDFTKVRLLKSETHCVLWPEDNKFKYKGICLDIYRCWKEPQTKYTRRLKGAMSAIQFHYAQISQRQITIAKRLRSVLALGYNVAKYLCIKPMDLLSPSKEMIVRDPDTIVPAFNSDWLFPLRTVMFNGRYCPIPNNAEAILASQYGRWEELPDPIHRVAHYQTVDIWEECYISKEDANER